MNRKIMSCHEEFYGPEFIESITDLRALLAEKADNCWLLAHADDGVIWGYITAGQVVTARDAAAGTPDQVRVEAITPELRLKTLQTVRLFAPDFEIMLWRAEMHGWYLRMIYTAEADSSASYPEAIDERYMLWGDTAQSVPNGFTLMADGAQGLHHIVPVEVVTPQNGQVRPLSLHVRHLIQTDEMGFARIAASRLVNLYVEEGYAG